MDTLVARYSRPTYEQNEPFENEAQELMDATSCLTTKFAMPPISQVRKGHAGLHYEEDLQHLQCFLWRKTDLTLLL